MKAQIVKCSSDTFWYSNISLPIKIEVECHRGFYKIIDGEYSGKFVANSDFINDEDYETRVFDSGAKRDGDDNKPYVHNLQGYTRLRFGYLTRMGANKYGDGNFLKGMPKEDSIKSLDRHLAKYLDGDMSEDHLAAIIFNVQLIMLEEKKEGMQADHYFLIQ